MKKYIPLLVALFVLLPGVAFTQTAASVPAPEWSVVRDDFSTPVGREVGKGEVIEGEDIVTLYRTANDRLYKDYEWTKDTTTTEYKIWNIFAAIAGKDMVKKYMTDYVTYNAPQNPTLAFVDKKNRKKELSWILAVNTSAADFANKKWLRDMNITLLHEYAHVLTLNTSQANAKQTTESSCKKAKSYLVSDIGCLKKNSYAKAYISKFWSAEDLATVARNQKARKAEDIVDLYTGRMNNFVTRYAATNPEEDIAETFTDFVLRSKPASSAMVKEQKILFFYQYPELVEMRTRIRAQIEQYVR